MHVNLIPMRQFQDMVRKAGLHTNYVGNHIIRIGFRRDGLNWTAQLPRFTVDGANFVAYVITSAAYDGVRDDMGRTYFYDRLNKLLPESDPLGLTAK